MYIKNLFAMKGLFILVVVLLILVPIMRVATRAARVSQPLNVWENEPLDLEQEPEQEPATEEKPPMILASDQQVECSVAPVVEKIAEGPSFDLRAAVVAEAVLNPKYSETV